MVTELICRYKELDIYSGNLMELMEIRKLLSVEAYGLGVKAAGFKKELEQKKGNRKIEFYKQQYNFLSEGVGKSVVKAEKAISTIREKEAALEGNYTGCKIILEQTNLVLSSISQDIAQLRLEYKSDS